MPQGCHIKTDAREIRQKKAGKPKFSSKFNREASRLGDVGSEDPSFQELHPEARCNHRVIEMYGFCVAKSTAKMEAQTCIICITMSKYQNLIVFSAFLRETFGLENP